MPPMQRTWTWSLLLLIIAIILIIIAMEMLDMHENSVHKNYVWRTMGYLLLISGVRILISFMAIIILPIDIRNHIKLLTRDGI